MTDQLQHPTICVIWVTVQDLQAFCAAQERPRPVPEVRGVWLQIVRVVPTYDLSHQKLPVPKDLRYGPLDQITVRVEDLPQALARLKGNTTVADVVGAWIQYLQTT